MSIIVEKPPTSPHAPVKSSRWAWLVLLASLVLLPFALGTALANPEAGDAILAVVVLVPPIATIWLGFRSGRTGNHLGGLATAVAGAWLTFITVFWIGANSVWSGESTAAPLALAILMALAVAVAVEAAWRRLWARDVR